tara:strand:+ start:1389 stop:1856 length:468 start_codon:yes stop_codon:yes gene_type:complete
LNPRIVNISAKKVIGMKNSMHHNEHENIVALWKSFMPNRKDIQSVINDEFIAIQVYSEFNKHDKPFNIIACVEVIDFKDIPDTMEAFTIPEGKYAVFLQKGLDAFGLYQRIMSEWLTTSGYEIDNRPHFQVMGEKYKNADPESEEDFYVPIKLRN